MQPSKEGKYTLPKTRTSPCDVPIAMSADTAWQQTKAISLQCNLENALCSVYIYFHEPAEDKHNSTNHMKKTTNKLFMANITRWKRIVQNGEREREERERESVCVCERAGGGGGGGRGGGGEENSNSKTLILKASSVRFIWTYLTVTANPCYTYTQREHELENFILQGL